MGKIVAAFSALAVLVSCLGLFGLASHTAAQRTREIGIRRVLGASVSDIALHLNRGFLALVLLANLIAWPTAFLILQSWLGDFAYRSPFDLWLFPGAAVLAVVIAVLTVSGQSIKAATADPVESLKHE